MDDVDARGHRVTGQTLTILLSSHDHTVTFQLPALPANRRWKRLLDTWDEPQEPGEPMRLAGGEVYPLRARSVAVFELHELPG